MSYDTFGMKPPGESQDFSSWLNSFGMGLGTDTGQFTPFQGMTGGPSWDFYNQATGGGTTPDYWNLTSGGANAGNWGLPTTGTGGMSIFGGGLNDYLTGTGGGFGGGMGGSMYDFGGSGYGNQLTGGEMGDLDSIFFPGSANQPTVYDNTPIFNTVGGSYQGGNLISGGGGYGGGGGGSPFDDMQDWWFDYMP